MYGNLADEKEVNAYVSKEQKTKSRLFYELVPEREEDTVVEEDDEHAQLRNIVPEEGDEDFGFRKKQDKSRRIGKSKDLAEKVSTRKL